MPPPTTTTSSSTTTTTVNFFHGLRENIIFVSCEITRYKNYCTHGPTRQNWRRTQQPTCNMNRYHHIDDVRSAPFPLAILSVGRNQQASTAKRVNVIAINGSQNGLTFKMLIFITGKRAIFSILRALLLML